ncbi:MAG: type II toxin-antitoxin system RelE family toxin, partial [Bryobacteraceae bacterium]
ANAERISSLAKAERKRVTRPFSKLQPIGNGPLPRIWCRRRVKPPLTGFRLRCGDHRVFFDHTDETTIEITGVRNRREAYR